MQLYVILDDTYGPEFVNHKNIASFNKTLKTRVYGKTKLFTNFAKTTGDSRRDLWNNIVERDYTHDPSNIPGLQTTANLQSAREKYQEAIINKVRLHDGHIRYLQVGGTYTKDPF